jgi:hypothetical protein
MRKAFALTVAVLVAAVLVAAVFLAGSMANPYTANAAQPHAVALADAAYAPDYLRVLRPMRATTVARQCGRDGYWPEVSAYKWNGAALGGQRWNAERTLTYWRAARGRVTFDGITWRNRTWHAVLVAGWCA